MKDNNLWGQRMNAAASDTIVGDVDQQAVNPEHYRSNSKLQAIDIINDFKLNFHQGTAVKYIIRAGRKTKDAKVDIKKAIWYLQDYLEQLQENEQ